MGFLLLRICLVLVVCLSFENRQVDSVRIGLNHISDHPRDDLKLVSLGCRSCVDAAPQVLRALQGAPPYSVRGWDEDLAPILRQGEILSGAKLLVSSAQLAALQATPGLKVAVLVHNLAQHVAALQAKYETAPRGPTWSTWRPHDVTEPEAGPDPPGQRTTAGASQVEAAGKAVRDYRGGTESESERREMLHREGVYDGFYEFYHGEKALVERINLLGRSFPDLCRVVWMREASVEKRDIAVLHLTNRSLPDSGRRPSVVILGTMHAREWISTMAVLFAAENLLRRYGRDEEATRALDSLELVVVPVVNPDGHAFTRSPTGGPCSSEETSKGLCDRLWRKNRAFPPAGSAGGCRGVDLNRNWGTDWGGKGLGHSVGSSTCDFNWPGPTPHSEPEVAAVAQLVGGLPRLQGSLDVHSYKQVVLAPWGFSRASPPRSSLLDTIGAQMAQAMSRESGTPYTYMGTGESEFYLASGVYFDWALDQAGAMVSYAVELRPEMWDADTLGFMLPPEEIIPTGEETIRGVLALMAGILQAQGGQQGVEAGGGSTAAVQHGTCGARGPWNLTVEFTSDGYPSEVSWMLLRTNSVVGMLPPRNATWHDEASYPHYEYRLCEAGRYTFVLRDSFGDGICCEHGDGAVTLLLSGAPIYSTNWLKTTFRTESRFEFEVLDTATGFSGPPAPPAPPATPPGPPPPPDAPAPPPSPPNPYPPPLPPGPIPPSTPPPFEVTTSSPPGHPVPSGLSSDSASIPTSDKLFVVDPPVAEASDPGASEPDSGVNGVLLWVISAGAFIVGAGIVGCLVVRGLNAACGVKPLPILLTKEPSPAPPTPPRPSSIYALQPAWDASPVEYMDGYPDPPPGGGMTRVMEKSPPTRSPSGTMSGTRFAGHAEAAARPAKRALQFADEALADGVL